jgi:hypothetical protein
VGEVPTQKRRAVVMLGRKPPQDFQSDLNSVPIRFLKIYADNNWPESGKWHDYAYHILRAMYRAYKQLKATGEGDRAALLKQRIKRERRYADEHYRENIREEINGDATKTKRFMCWVLSRRFFWALRRWGWFAIRSKGHPGNVVMLGAYIRGTSSSSELKNAASQNLITLLKDQRQGHTSGGGIGDSIS